MLDSWLSVGASCANNYGVLKSEDNGLSNVINADGILQNNDVVAGIPLTTQDGILTGTPQAVTMVGLSGIISVFGNVSQIGNIFSTFNGSWAALNGSTGANSTNKILIGQFTTDGVFTFELNIQVGTPTGGVQQFVAKNPTGSQIQVPSLIYRNVPQKQLFNININAMIQGFYIGSGLMNASIDPVGQPGNCDSIHLFLANAASPYLSVDSFASILLTNGTAQFKSLRTNLGGSYYLVLRHRNSIETWSANAVLLTDNMNYSFTASANSAYGDNLILTDDGLYYALYSGDVSDASNAMVGFQDGIVESQDYGDMENAVNATKLGYVPEDITGDQVVESADYGFMENNVFFTIVKMRP